MSEQQEHGAAKTFVEDRYFARGHGRLKVRETLMILVLWVVLLYPVAVLANSVAPDAPIWSALYHGAYEDGEELVRFLARAVAIVVVVVVLLSSTALLLRNNHRERKVYPERTTYDAAGAARRKAALEAMYHDRFGDEDFRRSARYYAVAPEQNLPTGFVHELLGDLTDAGPEVTE
ncbi:hypothetical protein [Xylanimonas protaetiae]|uniref:Uncharacterized protein n=1 Tax=Xylanimonas protaetiae TaxID=2509457 RepID=A0A4P6F229_9MICO|nr:hypothetical protein [Xylanimonas protaetiae]QAY69880.1 hypothetical protein ET471_07395 [Xylanimonas protaetiae]